jgi:hypothetical protein
MTVNHLYHQTLMHYHIILRICSILEDGDMAILTKDGIEFRN